MKHKLYIKQAAHLSSNDYMIVNNKGKEVLAYFSTPKRAKEFLAVFGIDFEIVIWEKPFEWEFRNGDPVYEVAVRKDFDGNGDVWRFVNEISGGLLQDRNLFFDFKCDKVGLDYIKQWFMDNLGLKIKCVMYEPKRCSTCGQRTDYQRSTEFYTDR